jgi:hypothetical protein
MGDIVKFKNYILLFVIYIFTIFLVIYLCTIYKNSSKNVYSSSISNLVVDVTSKDYDKLFSNIKDYGIENHHFIIYVASYNNDMSSFEKVFEKVIYEKSLKGRILYINSDNLKSFEHINLVLNDLGYSGKVKYSSLPLFIVVNGDKIVDVKSVSNYTEANLLDILGDCYD